MKTSTTPIFASIAVLLICLTSRADERATGQIDLPAGATDVVLGGSGRVLVVSLPTLRKAALIDLESAKIFAYLSIDADEFRIAAGKDKAVVELPEKRLLQRYDLATGKLEKSMPLPGDPGPMAMGCASAGPLLLGTAFVDLDTLKERMVGVTFFDFYRNQEITSGWGGFSPKNMTARPDGKVFISGKSILVTEGDSAVVYDDVGGSKPNPKIDALFPAAWTCFGATDMSAPSRIGIRQRPSSMLLPTVGGKFVVHLTLAEKMRNGVVRYDNYRDRYEVSGSILDPLTGAAVAQLPDMPEMQTLGSAEPYGAMPLSKRLIVDTERARLITVPADGEHVYIRKIGTIASQK